MLSFISLFILRARDPHAERPYRAWGYPWTTALALLGSVGFLIEAVREDRANSLLALVALACSYPVYRVLKSVSSRAAKKRSTDNRITYARRHGGKACIRGMRDRRQCGGANRRGPQHRRTSSDYPYLEREDILQALRYAAWLADEREAVLPNT